MEQKNIFLILLSFFIFFLSIFYFCFIRFMGGSKKILKNWEKIYEDSVDPNPSKFLSAIHTPVYLKSAAIVAVIFGLVALIFGVIEIFK